MAEEYETIVTMSNDPRQAPRPDPDDNDGFPPYSAEGATVEGINAEWKSKAEDQVTEEVST
jgi:hypothetical protein